ncbi:MAG: OB-fold domain-containing protein [Sinobacterium sp.]|nr:OB-fold domain-containing protein [Sinobacterium sp.]
MSQNDDVLRSEFDLDFTYTRTYGDVMSRFFTELKDKKLFGIKGSEGQIICPPLEYDPKTADTLSEFVELSDTGVITTWCWVSDPLDKHPLDRPFAWVLVKIDGADTAMLHALDASKAAVKTGAKVKVRWADERVGAIRDIACFEMA